MVNQEIDNDVSYTRLEEDRHGECNTASANQPGNRRYYLIRIETRICF